MGTEPLPSMLSPESRLRTQPSGESQLLQIRSDRRLGHEWDDWDGAPLPDEGVFHERESVFFGLAGLGLVTSVAAVSAVAWLASPRIAELWAPLPGYLAIAIGTAATLGIAWLLALAINLRSRRPWLPGLLAERGLVPWMMPWIERLGVRIGLSRDRVGNASLRVYNRLAAARRTDGMAPDDLLILLPRCLNKAAMQTAMGVSARYGVPMFVASRGRYARQMIAMRRPKGIVAVACERDLVSGVHDVAPSLPVLGTTLKLGDGPCKNTEFTASELEGQVRRMLGLGDRTAVD